MDNGWDPNHSLTGNEFLDFLSWSEIVGIDFEEKNQNNEEDNNIDINEQQESQRIIKKLKGRDKYE